MSSKGAPPTGAPPGGLNRLRIGKISYANLFPIFYVLEHSFDCSGYEFIEGVPSELNRRIRSGEIDISPSSSIEYLRHRDKYLLIENQSISAMGPVKSIVLFSRKPIEELRGQDVLTSSQSETSVALLQIILNKFYGSDCTFLSSRKPIAEALTSHAAYLLIGDDALQESAKWPGLHLYDLGDVWWRHTGLPITFALWLVRKGCCADNPGLLENFSAALQEAKVSALRNLGSVAEASPLRDVLGEEELVRYWQDISYDFGEEHKRGFDLFRRYSEELKLI